MIQPKDVLSEANDAFVAGLRGIGDVAREIFEAASHAIRRGHRRSATENWDLLQRSFPESMTVRRDLWRP